MELPIIDLEDEFEKVGESVKKGMAAGSITPTEGLNISTLISVGYLLIELNRKVEDINDVLESISLKRKK